MHQKSILNSETLEELEACLKDRDTLSAQSPISPMPGNGESSSKVSAIDNAGGGAKGSGVDKLDKKQIEQRIEEDRERHKRLRESIWAVDTSVEDELQRLMEETSDLCSDDFRMMEEESLERHAMLSSEYYR